MAPDEIKSCGWEWQHSAKIIMQLEPLICGAMATKDGQTLVSFRLDVFGCNESVRAMAFGISPLRGKYKAVPSGPVLLTPQHFPVASGRVVLDFCLGEAGIFLCSGYFCTYLYREKYTCCLPEHLLCPATFSVVWFCP